VKVSVEGTPQGGPLSPLPANIYLDALDKELERRGHAFCRYADDLSTHEIRHFTGTPMPLRFTGQP
jgi:retron-type reverse transcriptase